MSSRFLPATARRASHLRPSSAAFTTSARHLAGKEDKLHVEPEQRSAEVEHHADDSVSKAKQGKGEWKEELATSSESIVKAERGEAGPVTKEMMKRLQEESVKAAKKGA